MILTCLISVSCQEGIGRSRLSPVGGKRLKRLTIVSEVPTSRKRTTYETRRFLEPEAVSKTTSGLLRQSKRLTISEVPASRTRTTTQIRRVLEPEAVSKTTSGLPRQSKRLTISEVPTSRKRTTTQTRKLLEPEDASKTTSGLLRQSKRLSIVSEVPTSQKRTIVSEVPASRRLSIVSEVPTSGKRTTYETRRLLEPEKQTTIQTRRFLEPEDFSKTASLLLRQSLRDSTLQPQLASSRPEARSNYFDDLKQAKEGVWYRRVEDDEGVRLIRVKNDDAILNGDQRNSNYQLSVEEEDPSARFWYRRLDDGEGGVRLVRVRNDDITIKSLKTFRTQNITRTRTSEAV